MNFCAQCGNRHVAGARFCVQCGTPAAGSGPGPGTDAPDQPGSPDQPDQLSQPEPGGAGNGRDGWESRAALLAEAADPGTAPTRLHEIAARHPEARPALATNPATYPALLAWLGQLGDPSVDAGLRSRV